MAPFLLRFATARALAIAAPLLLAALPAAAELSNADRVAIAFRNGVCTIAANRVPFYLDAIGIAQDEFDAAVADMVARGFATGDPATPGAVVLNPDFCSINIPGVDPRRVMVQIMRFRGCALAEADTPLLMASGGFRPNEVESVSSAMIAAGEARREGDVLVLSDEVCANGVE